MPIFEYIGQEWQHALETLVFPRDKPRRPKCQSQNLSHQLSVSAMTASTSPDASASKAACGACVDHHLKPGDVVDVLCLGKKAQFRGVWCGKPGTEMAGEVGVESLPIETKIWGFEPLRCAASVGQG